MKKKIIMLLVVLSVFIAGTALAESFLGPIVTGNNVNVRKNPNKGASVLYQMNKGNSFILCGKHHNPGEKYPWYKIDINIEEGTGEENGWIYGQFVQIPKRHIKGTRVNMRQKASKNSPVLYCFPGNEEVLVTGCQFFDALDGNINEFWYQVEYKDRKGWVSHQYIR